MKKYIIAGILAGLLIFSFRTPAGADQLVSPPVLKVPFTSQAPLGQWSDIRQQDGCEEAAAAMAMAWVGGESGITKENWRLRILILSTFEYKKYGEYRDVTLSDVNNWLFRDYFKYKKTAVKPVTSVADIVSELEQGHLVLLPMNGQALHNPYFTSPGPERHMIIVKGYDYNTKEFITNDPGTRRGENYRYSEKVILSAIRVYPTGFHQAFGPLTKAMLTVEKK